MKVDFRTNKIKYYRKECGIKYNVNPAKHTFSKTVGSLTMQLFSGSHVKTLKTFRTGDFEFLKENCNDSI